MKGAQGWPRNSPRPRNSPSSIPLMDRPFVMRALVIFIWLGDFLFFTVLVVDIGKRNAVEGEPGEKGVIKI